MMHEGVVQAVSKTRRNSVTKARGAPRGSP